MISNWLRTRKRWRIWCWQMRSCNRRTLIPQRKLPHSRRKSHLALLQLIYSKFSKYFNRFYFSKILFVQYSNSYKGREYVASRWRCECDWRCVDDRTSNRSVARSCSISIRVTFQTCWFRIVTIVLMSLWKVRTVAVGRCCSSNNAAATTRQRTALNGSSSLLARQSSCRFVNYSINRLSIFFKSKIIVIILHWLLHRRRVLHMLRLVKSQHLLSISKLLL